MKILKRFKLGGKTIEVKFDPMFTTRDDFVGAAQYRTSEIFLQPSSNSIPLKPDQIEHAFCHELTHFIFHAMGEDKLRSDERLVDLFGTFLHQALTTAEYADENLPQPGGRGKRAKS